MNDLPPSVIVTAVTTLVSGFLGAILTNALNSRRSTNEKLWELRRLSYGIILFELKNVEHVLNIANSYIEEDSIRYFNDDVINQHNKKISEHMQRARNSFFENYLTLSDQFITEFEHFLHDISDDNPNLDPPEQHEQFAAAVRSARPKLLAQARSEMPTKERFFQRIQHTVRFLHVNRSKR